MDAPDRDVTRSRREWLGLMLASTGPFWNGGRDAAFRNVRQGTTERTPEFSGYFEIDISTFDDVYNPVTNRRISIREGIVELTAWSTRTDAGGWTVSVAGKTATGNRGTHATGKSGESTYEISGGGVASRTVEPPYPTSYEGEMMLVFEETAGAGVWFAKLSFGYEVNADGAVTGLRPTAIQSW